MADLDELRIKIDAIDKEIVKLFEERMDVGLEIADVKLLEKKRVLDAGREQERIRAVTASAKNPEYKKGVEELFLQIMSISRLAQYRRIAETGETFLSPFDIIRREDMVQSSVVYQGAPGAYTEAAMRDIFGEEADALSAATFRDVFAMLEEGRVSYGVVPIENSTAGVVSEIYDLLAEFNHYIVYEATRVISHCLLGTKGAKEDGIRRVFAHPQALSQSAAFLSGHPDWERIPMLNNAYAAKKVAKDGDMQAAAIAGKHAAKYYGLEILREGISNTENNTTRFIVVSARKVAVAGADKISICFELPHKAGALYRILSHFIYNGLNMVKIESRPIEERPFEYRFFLDFEGNLADQTVRNAMTGLREDAKNLRLLGNYTGKAL